MRKLFVIMCLGWSISTQAQNTVTFTGAVQDSLGHVMELANVVAYHVDTDKLTSYGVTDSEGRFYLKLEEGTTYVVRSTFIGYHTSEDTVLAKANESDPFLITLKSKVKQLENITIEEEFPVVISGDTISYKADAFKKGNERKLEDVLEGIPGFDVNENGEIKIQGKTVDKVLVEGKEFFEGDTKLAVQNIPANAVDRVQVLRNYSDISPMSALGNNNDRIALNIQLSEDKKNLIFGDVEAGIGLDDRHLAHANLFRYTPKSTVNFIGDMNNIGNQAFTPQDYFRFMGGMRNMMNASGSNFTLSDENMGFMNMQNDRALSLNSKLGAANFNYMPNKIWNISGFGIFSNAQTHLNSTAERTYINSQLSGNNELLQTSEIQENISGLAKLKAVYTPNADTQLSYEIFAKGSKLNDDISRLSENGSNSNTIESIADQKPLNFNQRIDFFKGLNDKNIFSVEAKYEYNRQNPSNIFGSDMPLFLNQIPLNENNGYHFNQYKNITTYQQELVANWYYIINRTNHLNFRSGNSFVSQKMNSSLNQQNNSSLDVSDYQNDFNFQFSDLYAGVNWRSRFGKLILNPGIYAHNYRTSDGQSELYSDKQKVLWLPQMTINYDFHNTQTLRFTYDLEARFMDIQKVAQGLIVQNYNSLFVGNQNITNSTVHNFNLNYTNFSLFSHYSIFGGLNYQRIGSNISESTQYQNLERLNMPINVDDVNDLFAFYGNMEKSFKKFIISADANVYYTNTSNQIEGTINKNQSFTQQYELSFETRLAKIINIEVGYERTYNQYNSVATSNDYINDQPSLNLDIAICPWLSWLVDYEYNYYRAKDGSSNSKYKFLNSSIVIQEDKSPWQFTLSGTNLLETEFIRRDSFSNNLVGTYAYHVQPRYFTFSVKFDI